MPNVWDMLCNIKAIGGWLMKGYLKCTDVTNKMVIPIGGKVKLVENARILLQKGQGGRLLMVQMAGRV